MFKKVLDEMKEKGITLTELHRRTGIPMSTLSETLNGKSSKDFRFSQAVQIQTALESDTPIEILFSDEE